MDRRETSVCVVGAGFAGLAAARYLLREGTDVVVVEARDRVGGRAWNRRASDGTVVSVGGTWLGAGQDRMFELAREAGVGVHRQHYEGDAILRLDGENRRYAGLIPGIGPIPTAALALTFARLDLMAKRVPIERPWDAGPAARWDAMTLGQWISSSRNVPSSTAQVLARTALGMLMCSELSQVSLLGALVLARGGGGVEYYADPARNATHVLDGGPAGLADRIGARIGARLVLSSPVRRIVQTDDHVEIRSDAAVVRARRVVVATPPSLAAMIDYEPALPPEHGQLMRRVLPGMVTRFHTVYERAFWREQGLRGQSVDPESPLPFALDQSPPSGVPGVLSAYAFGGRAIELARRDPVERREMCLCALADRYGPRAATPVGYLDTDWSAEPWSLGGMIGFFPPGTLTSFGPALRASVGRIHWAGAERATIMHGLMEGAVRSGERAAAEALAADRRLRRDERAMAMSARR